MDILFIYIFHDRPGPVNMRYVKNVQTALKSYLILEDCKEFDTGLSEIQQNAIIMSFYCLNMK